MFRAIIIGCLACTTLSAAGQHAVKLNLNSLVVKNFALQYEQAVGRKTSLALGVRVQPYGTVPFQDRIKDEVNDPDIQVQNIQLGNFAITPEFRYYFGRHGMKGFYVAPYARYASYKMEAPVNYNSLLTQKTAFFKGDISSFSGGLLFGNQFQIGKHIIVDLWIIGGHFGSSNGSLRFTASLTPQEQDDIRQTLANTDIPLFDISYDINSNGGTITSKGAWIGFRGLAVNLGLRF
jgi:hypothetical protein